MLCRDFLLCLICFKWVVEIGENSLLGEEISRSDKGVMA